MSDYFIAPRTSFVATSDAIREKTGSQDGIVWGQDGFASTLNSLTAYANSVTGESDTNLSDAVASLADGYGGGTGLTEDIKQALLQIAQKVAYIDEDGQDYYDDLYDALYAITAIRLSTNSIQLASIGATSQLTATTVPGGGTVTWSSSDTSVATIDKTGLVTSVAYGSATITATSGSVSATCSVLIAAATCTGITAVYTQSGTVYDSDSLDSLKSDLVVTASWSNGTTTTLTDSDYTLSGTLEIGTSTVTVSYAGQTTTFNVTVVGLVSITATYTQSGTVYETASLDDLKTDLVVTANYSDSSTSTVASTDYTLSGTLTEGTSTITVTYSGKTTTFTVIVTAETILYPLENGTHVFTDSNRQLIVSNGNHFEYTSGYTTSGNYVNLSNVSDNDTRATQASNINNHETIYTIPANSTVRFAVKNIKGTPVGVNSNIALALRSGSSSSVVTTGNQRPSGSADGMLIFDDIDLTFNVTSAIAVGCLFLYAEKEYTSLSADVELYVDGVRWT